MAYSLLLATLIANVAHHIMPMPTHDTARLLNSSASVMECSMPPTPNRVKIKPMINMIIAVRSVIAFS
jgi:hypothetical protein